MSPGTPLREEGGRDSSLRTPPSFTNTKKQQPEGYTKLEDALSREMEVEGVAFRDTLVPFPPPEALPLPLPSGGGLDISDRGWLQGSQEDGAMIDK